MGKAAFQIREVATLACAEARLLCCVQNAGGADGPEGAAREARAFFQTGIAPDAFEAGSGTEILERRSIGEGAVLRLRFSGAAPQIYVEGAQVVLPLTLPEQDLFAGLNVALAQRNGETAAATLAWLRYHQVHHGLEAAVILDRARPGTDGGYLEGLEAGLSALDLRQVLVLRFDVPLGQRNQPAEAHPFSAPDAPGKDRMERPHAAPWEAPLGEVQLLELIRHRWLNTARAVALLDISDLVSETKGNTAEGQTLFDIAVHADGGVVTLLGRHCYPWRLRNGQAATHGDHICVQFDAGKLRRRWVVAPQRVAPDGVWRLLRVAGAKVRAEEWVEFFRCMALRHPCQNISQIVPKTSLMEEERLLTLARERFGHKPIRMSEIAAPKVDATRNEVAIVTCMKNEGPFILEWLAYHRAIGVERFLVYTNDCTDGTDSFLELLQDKGFVQHRDNPFKGTDLKPQHAALQAAEHEAVIREADWVISMDVDEFINIKTGDGRLPALFEAVGDANMIACTWRLFGNSDVHGYSDRPLMAQFTRAAPEQARKPHQAWGFKTLYRNIGLFKKLGVHRPKGLNPQLWSHIRWVNGSGKALPKDMYRNAWRSTAATVGYDLVQLNHYAVRSAESFLVKRDRGRVNHVDRDQGLAYWFRMNNNSEEETSIQRMIPAMQAELAHLLADPEIAEAHAFSVDRHRAKITALRQAPDYARFYEALTSHRQERLARMHAHFGANVFLAGPDVIPDWVVARDLPDDFFFTVEKQDTAH